MKISVCQVLDAIDELGTANAELVACELSLLDRDVAPTWQQLKPKATYSERNSTRSPRSQCTD
jgi:hypothetical protein